jgi:rRNA-processing protein FCF1
VSDRPVRVVLDTSAIMAYVHGSIDVGEVIAEVDDELMSD